MVKVVVLGQKLFSSEIMGRRPGMVQGRLGLLGSGTLEGLWSPWSVGPFSLQ